MKWINHSVRLAVGLLFIFSGLIKLNDPVGTEIKLEEYFEVFASDKTELGLAALKPVWEALLPFSLSFSVILSTLEVVLGLSLLILYRVRLTLWLLFLTIVFFTFLTFYSAYFNKVTDCGCFGDAIKLTPWQSFGKDIVLLVLISWLFFQKQAFTPPPSNWVRWGIITGSTLLSLLAAFWAIHHLPFIDFRPYKVGNHIPSLMKPSAELKYGEGKYIYKNLKTGKEEVYTEQEYTKDNRWEQLSDTTRYQYVNYERPLLNPEAQARITDYRVMDAEGQDYTPSTFEGKKLLIILPDVARADTSVLPELERLTRALEEKKKIESWVLTASDYQTYEAFRTFHQFSPRYFFTDKTVLKTMIRANPGLIYLNNGRVMQKWHYNDLPVLADFQ
ncbi:MAG: DoxX family protein [Microscillaceae bacterium]|nr:DoxX family protein [Microscillaceae bacterium]